MATKMATKMSKRNIEAVYPLSPMQQGMLFHSLYAPESGVYFEQLSCTLRGDLDVAAFERAWQRVVERHPILRTSFVWKRLDKTLQVVHRRVELPLEKQDWRGLSPDEQEAQLEAFLQAERRRGFNLAQPPLLPPTSATPPSAPTPGAPSGTLPPTAGLWASNPPTGESPATGWWLTAPRSIRWACWGAVPLISSRFSP